MSRYWIAFFIGLSVGAVPVWVFQGARLDAVQARYDEFVHTTKVIGEQAAKAAKDKELADKKAKERSDAEYKKLESASLDIAKRLQNARASVRYLPTPSATARNPATACFRRSELESAIQRLDGRVSGIVAKGNNSRIGLDVAKERAQIQ